MAISPPEENLIPQIGGQIIDYFRYATSVGARGLLSIEVEMVDLNWLAVIRKVYWLENN